MGDFKGGTTNTILPREIQRNQRKPKENLRFSKSFQTGSSDLSSRGGGNKVNKNGKLTFLTLGKMPK